jgi:hypothetical protein
MVSKLSLAFSLVLGIGIGLVAPLFVAIASDGVGHGNSSHGTTTNAIQPKGEARMHVTRSATVETKYPPHLTIQLFTAEGEKYWLGDIGWNPSFLRGDGFSRNDVFAVGPNTFITIAYDAEAGIAQYARVEQGKTAGIIDIEVTASNGGSAAKVTYNTTSVSDDGDEALGSMTDEAFAAEMASWQAAIAANDDAIHNWFASRN